MLSPLIRGFLLKALLRLCKEGRQATIRLLVAEHILAVSGKHPLVIMVSVATVDEITVLAVVLLAPMVQ